MKSIACKYVKNQFIINQFQCSYFHAKAKKAVLFPEVGRVKKFLSLTLPHSPMYIRIYNFNFKKQTSKKEARIQKTQKKRKKKREYLRKIVLKY